MNGWMIAFIVWYAVNFVLVLNRATSRDPYIEVSVGGTLLGAFISVFLLYMGGAFS